MHFLQFFADHSKKSKFIKAIYIYASERSRYVLSENGFVCYAVKYCFPEFEVKEFFEISAESASFLYFICYYLMNSGSDSYKSYHFQCNDNF